MNVGMAMCLDLLCCCLYDASDELTVSPNAIPMPHKIVSSSVVARVASSDTSAAASSCMLIDVGGIVEDSAVDATVDVSTLLRGKNSPSI